MHILIEVRDDEYRASKTVSETDGDRGYIRFPAERIANGIILPEHYGRLIDAKVACPNHIECVMCPVAIECPICAAPTIIPASAKTLFDKMEEEFGKDWDAPKQTTTTEEKSCETCIHKDDDFDCRDFCVPYGLDHYTTKEGE